MGKLGFEKYLVGVYIFFSIGGTLNFHGGFRWNSPDTQHSDWTVQLHVMLNFCLFIRPTLEFSVIWKRHHCQWRAANFHLCSITCYAKFLFVCLFRVIRPTLEFSVIWKRHHCQWRAANYDLCSALMAIEQWGFFSVSHLLWHGASVYNGHLRGPVTLTPFAERLAVELSLSVIMTYNIPTLGILISIIFITCNTSSLSALDLKKRHVFFNQSIIFLTYLRAYACDITRFNLWLLELLYQVIGDSFLFLACTPTLSPNIEAAPS